MRRSSTFLKFVPVCSILLLVLLSLTVFPISHETYYTEATSGTASETTLTLSSSNVSLSLTPSATGTFSSSTTAEQSTVSVTTTNYTGYTLKLASTGTGDASSRLTNASDNTKYLSSIPAGSSISQASFRDDATYNNKWGYLPSKFNSSANTNYRPAPSTSGDTLDKTTAANSNANTYTIALGARADLTNPAGDYSNTFIITATANPIAYSISYDQDAEDASITDMPGTQSAAEFTGTSITLNTKEPTRNIHLFQGWCTGDITGNSTPTPSCTGTIYQAGAEFPINQTTQNIVTLTAIWKLNAFTVTINVSPSGYGTVSSSSLQAPAGSTISISSNTITIGSTTITATKAADTSDWLYSFKDWTNNCGNSVSGNCTITANFTRAAACTGTMLGGVCVKYLQDFYNTDSSVTTAIKNAMVEEQEYTFIDNRADKKSYKVAKLKDGNVWMMENLRLGKTDADMELTSVNTDLAEGATFTLPAHVASWTSTYTAAMIHVSDDQNTDSTKGALGYYGYYYNYYAASAGTVTNSGTVNASASICPKGWTLPDNYTQTQGQSYANLLVQYGVISSASSTSYATDGYTKLTSAPLKFVLSGYHYTSGSSVASRGSVGRYWSGTSNSTTSAYYLYFYSSFVAPRHNYDKSNGVVIRCVASS